MKTSRSRSRSVEGQLDSSGSSTFGQEVTSAGKRLGRSASVSRARGARTPASVGRPQSMEVHIVTVDELGRPSPGPSSATAIERQVHVSIPEQPWTKPFANVRLRQRAARVIDSDNYQSSSGRVYCFVCLFYSSIHIQKAIQFDKKSTI